MTKEEFLKHAAARYDELQQLNQDQELSFYNYEQRFSQLWTELGREVLQSSLDSVAPLAGKKTLPDALRTNRIVGGSPI